MKTSGSGTTSFYNPILLREFGIKDSLLICRKFGVRKVGSLAWISSLQLEQICNSLQMQSIPKLKRCPKIVFNDNQVLYHPDYVLALLRRVMLIHWGKQIADSDSLLLLAGVFLE